MKINFPSDYIEVLRSKEGVFIHGHQENKGKMTEIDVDFAKNIFAFCHGDCLRKLQILTSAGLTLSIINYSQIGSDYLIEFDRRGKSAEIFNYKKIADFSKLEKFAARLSNIGFIEICLLSIDSPYLISGGENLYVFDVNNMIHISDPKDKLEAAKNNAITKMARFHNIENIHRENFTINISKRANLAIELYEANPIVAHDKFCEKLEKLVV